VARHLAAQGARRLLLVSRRGPDAEGVLELQGELQAQGCEVTIAACDVTDRAQLAELIDAISEEHPLTTVVHAAGALDDGVISSLDEERLATVLAPKVEGAINLHELTAELELAELIFFSSAPSAIGSAGQGNYAAANAFLDALAHQRRASGLAARSLAWGLWANASSLVSGLDEDARQRYAQQIHARLGLVALTPVHGLELMDRARRVDRPLLLPMRLDPAALRARAGAGMLAPALAGLVRMPAHRQQEASGSLASRLAETPKSDWRAIVEGLVLAHVAAVLGHASAASIDPQRPFKEAGFDSLGAVELRNRLARATGVKLASTLVFDYPSPAAVADFLLARATEGRASSPAGDEELDRLEGTLAAIGGDDAGRERIVGRLRALLVKLADEVPGEQDAITAEMIEAASEDEILQLVDMELNES
jgi:acyl carrier protein